MQLVVIRHAIAEPRESADVAGVDDSDRPLTERGQKRMAAAAAGLKKLVPRIDVLATSPLARAAQTAEIVCGEYEGLAPTLLDDLAPQGERRSVLTWMQMQMDGSTLAVVGHEPYLRRMVSWLLATPDSHFIQLKKSGACLLQWKSHLTAGDARLAWLLSAAQLRKLGKRKKPDGPEKLVP